MTYHEIENMSEYEFKKKYIKQPVRKAAFTEPEEIRTSHSKVSQNKYTSLNRPQENIRSTSRGTENAYIRYK